jgi:hypothetical protein
MIWGDNTERCEVRLRYRYHEYCSIATRHGCLGHCYIKDSVVTGRKRDSQHKDTKDDLKILLRILSIQNSLSHPHS